MSKVRFLGRDVHADTMTLAPGSAAIAIGPIAATCNAPLATARRHLHEEAMNMANGAAGLPPNLGGPETGRGAAAALKSRIVWRKCNQGEDAYKSR